MLPFMKPKARDATLIVQERKPDGIKESHSDDSHEPGLLIAAEDLCKAVESKDYSRVAAALKAAFEIMDSAEPSEPESQE